MTQPEGRRFGAITRFGWYPLLLGLAWLLQAYTVGRVEPAAAARSFVVIVVVSLVVTVIAIRFLGRDRGSLVAAIVLIGLVAAKTPVLAIPFIAGVVLLVVERRWSDEGRLHLPWPRIHEALTLFVGVLFLVQLVQFATRADPAPLVSADAWAGQPLNDAARPNIYLILADAHGREDILRDDYDYDDRPLLDELEAQGFDISSGSRSNYGLTRFSIGSMLTGSYLDRLNDATSTTTQDDAARRTIHDNPAFPLLRRAGYGVTVISSGYEHLGLRSADRFIDTGQPNEFEEVVAQNIAATGLWTALQPDGKFEAVRARTRDELAALLEIAADPDPRPRFVLTHLPSPHWPYVFTETCDPAHPIEGPVEGIGRGGGDPETVGRGGRADEVRRLHARQDNRGYRRPRSRRGRHRVLRSWAGRAPGLVESRCRGHRGAELEPVRRAHSRARGPVPGRRDARERAADRCSTRTSAPSCRRTRTRSGSGHARRTTRSCPRIRVTAEGEARATRRRPRRAFVIAAIAYLALAIGVGGPLLWPVVAPDRMLVIGHSGDVANWPRNSMHSVIPRCGRAPTASSSTSIARRRGPGGCSMTGTSPRPRPVKGRSRSMTDAELGAIGSTAAWVSGWPRAPRPRAWLA